MLQFWFGAGYFLLLLFVFLRRTLQQTIKPAWKCGGNRREYRLRKSGSALEARGWCVTLFYVCCLAAAGVIVSNQGPRGGGTRYSLCTPSIPLSSRVLSYDISRTQHKDLRCFVLSTSRSGFHIGAHLCDSAEFQRPPEDNASVLLTGGLLLSFGCFSPGVWNPSNSLAMHSFFCPKSTWDYLRKSHPSSSFESC